MIKKEYWDKKTPFELEINGKKKQRFNLRSAISLELVTKQ